jgi:hypothetical protein
MLTVLLNDLSVQHGVVVDMKVVHLSLVETFVSIGCQCITETVVLRLRTLYRQSCDESVRERRVEDSAVLA